MGEARQNEKCSLLIAGGGEASVEENITHKSSWQLPKLNYWRCIGERILLGKK